MPRRISAILSLDVVSYTAQMASDPTETLARLRRTLDDVVRPTVRIGQGRIFKLMGDGALIEFATAADAISTAQAIQSQMRDHPLLLRAGVDAGDVTTVGDDVFGEAVNMATRLQAAALPGGCMISAAAAALAGGGLQVSLRPEGDLALRGVAKPVPALSLDLDGDRDRAERARWSSQQNIRFTASNDGTRIAWTETGEGRPVVKAPHWIQHLEYEWEQNPLDGWLPKLSGICRLVRGDTRNNGLSDRGVADVSFERLLDDLEAVFDAAGLDRAPVFGLSFGATIAAGFAASRPERVSGLVLMNGFVQGMGQRAQPRDLALGHAFMDLSRNGWDDAFPSVRHLFAQTFSPEASPHDQHRYAEFMKLAMDLPDWLLVGESVDKINLSEQLSQIRCPTLVLHAERERIHNREQGRRLAAGIAEARLVSLDTANNTMPVYDPAWPQAMTEIEAFLGRI